MSNRFMEAKNRAKQGFTLIELLVVIAITAILFTIIFKPIIDSFNLANRAATQIESQSDSRGLMSSMNDLLQNSVFVFDNKTPESRVNLWFPQVTPGVGNCFVPAQFAMLEAVLPARQLDQSPTTTLTDPTTGLPIYTGLPAGQTGYAFPITAGRTLVRVFTGLLDNKSGPDTHTVNGANPDDGVQDGMPLRVYGNMFNTPAIGNTGDNRYTVYRAEVTTSITDPSNPQQFIPNLKLFHTGQDTNGNTNTRLGQLILHDPNFFYDNSLAGDSTDAPGDVKWAVPGWKDLNGDGKVEIWENWAAVSTSLLPARKVDMVSFALNDTGTEQSDAYNRPIVRPLASFAPAYIQNDPGTATSLNNAGAEAPNPASVRYSFQHDHWANPYMVQVYRDDTGGDPMVRNPGGGVVLDFYQATGNGQILHYNAVPGSTPTLADPGDVGPHLIANGVFDPTQLTNIKFAYGTDADRGLVTFDWPAWTMVHGPAAILNGKPYYQPLASMFDPAAANGGMLSAFERRYIDLRGVNGVLPALDSNGNPLNPASAMSPLGTNWNWANSVAVVPGSEKVYGPDQRPGPHYGWRQLYTRVASLAGVVGLNQYRINYQDVPNAAAAGAGDPRVKLGYLEFDSTPDTTDPNAPNLPAVQENPLNGLFRPHSLPQLKVSTLGANVPADPLEITYDFQMNRTNDVLKVDYQTRDLMNFTLDVRLFDPATAAPQTAELTQTIAVRNLQH